MFATHEPSQTEAGKLVTGNLSLVIGHLEGDTAKRRIPQSPITSDQLPVTSEPPLVQGPNARPNLEVEATHEPRPGRARCPHRYVFSVGTCGQPGGLPESSRGRSASADPPEKRQKGICTPAGVPEREA